jgi:hypothetical protein
MGKRVLALGREDKKVSTILLLPPTGGKNMPEVDRDSAVPTAATVVEVYIWESHLRAVGVAVIARIVVKLVLTPDNRCCCCCCC